ncbi:deoxyguanosinetriphosphate triphosphohydrolase family protein [Spongisporangium articulatum]|uniref:Deoxyguanosinetriphosphate triphosphohydrolase family protein n=1 Tax=Spongisporangium articulatum TaxID=3362603 RepID=A0ABW8AHR6_9ACTN
MTPTRTDRRDGDTYSTIRSPFRRDRDRILYSPAFRRLAGVTQVVSPYHGQSSHNRLIHTIKVGQVARGIADQLHYTHGGRPLSPDLLDVLDPDVVEAASLAHDLGHPPFGHAGESQLQELFPGGARDSFEGNAQSFRIATRLVARKGDERGLNLTRATLRALLKYPWLYSETPENGEKMKWGAYEDDRAAFHFAMTSTSSSPATPPIKSLEAAVMDWADDVTYAIHDVEDFFRAGLIPLDEIRRRTGRWPAFARWYVKEHPRNSQLHLDQARDLLGDLLPSDQDLNGRKTRRDIDLALFVSRGIDQCIKETTLESNYSTGEFNLKPPDHLRGAVDVLKQLVHYFVISGPELCAAQTGQRKMIEAVFDYFCRQANKVEDHNKAHLPVLALDAAKKARKKGRLKAARVACDALCELTDTQVISLYGMLTGNDNSMRDLHRTSTWSV